MYMWTSCWAKLARRVLFHYSKICCTPNNSLRWISRKLGVLYHIATRAKMALSKARLLYPIVTRVKMALSKARLRRFWPCGA